MPLKGFLLERPAAEVGGSCSLGTAQSVLLHMLFLLLHVLLDGRILYSACPLGRLGYVAHVSSHETSELGNAHRKTFDSKVICIFAN